MKKEEFMEKVRNAQYNESFFAKIMHATSLQELIDIPLKPEELLDYFAAAEEIARIEEKGILCCNKVVANLKEARPAKSARRALFM